MIPKILHQIWVGDKPISDAYRAYQASWKRLHPDWMLCLWTDQNLPVLLNPGCYEQAPNPAAKSDVLRYEVVYNHGGVYADMDVEALKNLDSLLNCSEFLVWETLNYMIASAIFGAEQHHPFLARVITGMAESMTTHPGDQLGSAGPAYLTRVYHDYAKNTGPINVFPAELFFPYYWHNREKRDQPHPEAYTSHHWACSWR